MKFRTEAIWTLIVAGVFCCAATSAAAKAAETPPPPPQEITHVVPTEGATKAGSFGSDQTVKGNPPVVDMYTTAAPGYRFVKFYDPKRGEVYSKIKVGSDDPRDMWQIVEESEFDILAEAVMMPGARINAEDVGFFTPFGQGPGELEKWGTISVDVNLDGDTNRDGYANLDDNPPTKADQDEDANKAAPSNPGVIVAVDPTDEPQLPDLSTRILLRKVLPLDRPIGTVKITQLPVGLDGDWKPVLNKDGTPAPQNDPRIVTKGGSVKLFRNADRSGEVNATDESNADDLWTDAKDGPLTLYVAGTNPGRLQLTAEYEVTTSGGTIHFHDTINVTVLGIALISTPRVAAADVKASIPLHFRVVGLAQVYIDSVVVKIRLKEATADMTYVSNPFKGGDHLLGGDWVLARGTAGTNGSMSDYTQIIDPNLFAGIVVHNKHGHTLPSDSFSYSLDVSVKAAASDSTLIKCTSNELEISEFCDVSMPFVELGVNHSISSATPQYKESSYMLKANPYVEIQSEPTPSLYPGGQVFFVQSGPVPGYFKSAVSKPVPPRGPNQPTLRFETVITTQAAPLPLPKNTFPTWWWYFSKVDRTRTLTATGYDLSSDIEIPDESEGPWQNLNTVSISNEMEGEERGVMYGLYYGRKGVQRSYKVNVDDKPEDLTGAANHTVGPIVDCTKISYDSMNVELFPKATVKLDTINQLTKTAGTFDTGAAFSAVLNLIGAACAIVGPEGWGVTAMTEVVASGLDLYGSFSSASVTEATGGAVAVLNTYAIITGTGGDAGPPIPGVVGSTSLISQNTDSVPATPFTSIWHDKGHRLRTWRVVEEGTVMTLAATPENPAAVTASATLSWHFDPNPAHTLAQSVNITFMTGGDWTTADTPDKQALEINKPVSSGK